MRRTAMTLAAAVFGLAAVAHAGGPQTLAEAQKLAESTGKPLLLDFFTDWCGPCKAFARAAESDGEIQKALDRVILFSVDAEKGDGVGLAKRFQISFYPTFVLANAGAETLERWTGYEKPYFLQTQAAALADPTTIAQKQARFEESPTAVDAEKLARFHLSSSHYLEAVDLYRRAAELDGDRDFAYEIFDARGYGFDGETITAEQVQESADAAMASADLAPREAVNLYLLMQRVEQQSKMAGLATPYLERSLAAAESDDTLESAAKMLRVEHALRIAKDKDKAFDMKVASLPEGWKDDPSGLNSVAWWCFENGVRLEEAEALARRGVELAPAGSEKAMILDTAAEICNARGNCPEAIVLIQEAVENAPGREYYQRQLVRFQELQGLVN